MFRKIKLRILGVSGLLVIAFVWQVISPVEEWQLLGVTAAAASSFEKHLTYYENFDTISKNYGSVRLYKDPARGSSLLLDHARAKNYYQVRHVNLNHKNFSVAFWAKQDTQKGPGWILSHAGGGDAANNLRIGLNSQDELMVILDNNTKKNSYSVPVQNPALWHHYAITYTDNLLKIYIDGERVAKHKQVPKTSAGQSLVIGAGVTNNVIKNSFDGALDDFRLYDDALGKVVVRDLFNATKHPSHNSSIYIEKDSYVLKEAASKYLRIPFTVSDPSITVHDVSIVNVPDLDRFSYYVYESATGFVLAIKKPLELLPILTEEKTFYIKAGTELTQLNIRLEPVNAPDIYILAGQSNMVGNNGQMSLQRYPYSGYAADTPDRNPDCITYACVDNSNVRILQLGRGMDYGYTARGLTVPENLSFGVATDPLQHASVRNTESVGLGLTFAKNALPSTSRTIILVPVAEGGTGFSTGHWSAGDPLVVNDGDVRYEDMVMRTTYTLEQTGGVVRGILWQQGEADTGTYSSQFYQDELVNMVTAFRTEIAPFLNHNQRASEVPLLVGTMKASYVGTTNSKLVVDNVHRNIAALVPLSTTIILTDVTAGNYREGDVTHYGQSSLREAGRRYWSRLKSLAKAQTQ